MYVRFDQMKKTETEKKTVVGEIVFRKIGIELSIK